MLRIGIGCNWLEQLEIPNCLKLFSEPQRVKLKEEPEERGCETFWHRCKENKRRREFEKQLEQQREGARQAVIEKLLEFLHLILPLVDYPQESRVVFDETLCRKSFPLLWKKVCGFPEFDGYMRERWIELLLPYATKPDYLVLGNARLLQNFLWSRGIRMRTLTWILPGYLYTDDVQQFEEDFLYEFGLAIDMQVIGSVQEYRKIPIKSRESINILDFSGEDKLNVTNLHSESIWLDMSSSEKKKRRIKAANPQISYISLKNMWEEAKKDSIVLDTNSKNRYNTVS